MKILFNGEPIIKSAGIGEYTKELITSLAEISDCEIMVHFKNENEIDLGSRVKKVFGKNSYSLSEFDIYHSTNHFIPRIKNKKIIKIVTIHDVSNYVDNRFFPYHKRLYKHLILSISKKRADHIIAVSRNTKLDLIKYLQIPEDKISVVYNGINSVYRSRISEDTLSEVRKKYKLPQNFILFVGTIEPRKNIINLVNAYNNINDKNIALVIVGKKGWMYNPILKTIMDSPKRNKILLLEKVSSSEDLAAIYQLASLFVFPSFYEGFGLPVIEAMASRVPVITSSISSLPEIAKDGVYYIDPQNTDSIAQKINEVLSSDISEKITKAELISQQYNWKNAAEQTYRIYQEVLARR